MISTFSSFKDGKSITLFHAMIHISVALDGDWRQPLKSKRVPHIMSVLPSFLPILNYSEFWFSACNKTVSWWQLILSDIHVLKIRFACRHRLLVAGPFTWKFCSGCSKAFYNPKCLVEFYLWTWNVFSLHKWLLDGVRFGKSNIFSYIYGTFG